MTWSPGQYLKFEDERTRPARDLLAAVPLAEADRVVDIGCGPGNSTELLAARYPDAEVVGIDSSPDMLKAARKRLPSVAFVEADVASWMPDPPADLLFANAVFQWVPDHLSVLARLMGGLRRGGVLAVQVPDNFAEPSHALMQEVAAAGPWRAKLAAAAGARETIPSPHAYYDRLKPLSASIDLWHTTYYHPLDKSGGHRRMAQEHRPSPLSRAARCRRAGGLPRRLRGPHRGRLPAAGRRPGDPAASPGFSGGAPCVASSDSIC